MKYTFIKNVEIAIISISAQIKSFNYGSSPMKKWNKTASHADLNTESTVQRNKTA